MVKSSAYLMKKQFVLHIGESEESKIANNKGEMRLPCGVPDVVLIKEELPTLCFRPERNDWIQRIAFDGALSCISEFVIFEQVALSNAFERSRKIVQM